MRYAFGSLILITHYYKSGVTMGSHPSFHFKRASIWLATIIAITYQDVRAEDLGSISVTDTREERSTEEVPQSIAVVDSKELQSKKMFNLKEGIQEIPGVLIDSANGGYDARLIIRGAGLKAAYGIREIMVLRDGVPLTDPTSFTSLDSFDPQDIERIEVAKGPGNLFATGSAGGAIQIISKSVFDESANSLKIGAGNYGAQNFSLRDSIVGKEQAVAVTLSHRAMDNDWRTWNKFDTTQASLKHGLIRANGDILESEFSFSEANIQLPGTMNKTLFDQFVTSGKQTDTSTPWKDSGRYSKVYALNTKYEMQRGDFTFRPRIYYNTWYQYHPVTGFINETESWVWNLGTDLEAQYKHTNGTLVGGITVREEKTPDSRKYQYSDVTTGFGGRITATLSDAKGALASTETTTSLLNGVYLQESWRPGERWIIDAGFRYDIVYLRDSTNEITAFNYSTGTYVAGGGLEDTRKNFYLPAPKVAVSYKLSNSLHLFAMAAQAGQIPSSSEISSNPNLDAAIARNYEVGLKGRNGDWQFDSSVYFSPVEKEIVLVNTGGVNEYVNAGKTDKKGAEFTGSYSLSSAWDAGAHYTYSNFTFDSFSEPVRVGTTTVNKDRTGNHLPFVPTQQYGVFVRWKPAEGWYARIASNSWGSYWLDNANTQKYDGWDWVTNLTVGYTHEKHSVTLNADNIFDKHYAFEVKKDTSGNVTYTAAAPRTVFLNYRYNFQ